MHNVLDDVIREQLDALIKELKDKAWQTGDDKGCKKLCTLIMRTRRDLAKID